ncbi:transcriptional regulator, TetR family [Phenylobacterium zucineum HLK1]|uniref:Transcriptional regulator, TetR family n=1 Tax=Phenylobacterium zucineum (strain HLK1) TaxID=450851 RepID=B4RC35_PHEZH|nr:TetR/AcrR family transcriptional regulator [Phenylobacterium zucineum]ACG79828.1 transcriptional regulator, TetR family [Phenylobacterium zucineum HLK1]
MVQKEERDGGRRRGRPRSFDPDAVLEKARAVFWNLGYAATSLDDLAAATGLNRPSLYAAFGDKRALYLAALGRSRDEALGALGRALQPERPLRQVIAFIFERSIELYRAGEVGQRGCFVVGTAVTQAVEDAEVRSLVADFIERTEAAFRARFAADAGQLAPGLSPAAAAAVAAATLHTLAIRARTGADGPELKRVADAALEALFGTV